MAVRFRRADAAARRGGAGSGPRPRPGWSSWRPASAWPGCRSPGGSLSPDEAGYLIVGGQWAEGSSLYGDYWVDRPPVLIAIFEAADALGGAVPLRLIGALAAVLTVVLSGVLGRIAAPERRSAPLLTAGTAAVCVATPLFGGTVVNGELLGLPFLIVGILAYVAAAASRHQVRAFLLSLAAGAAGALGGAGQAEPGRRLRAWRSSCCFTSGAARRRFPALLAGALVTTAVVVAAAWARGTVPADLWDAVVTFRVDAARELAGDSGNAPARLAGLRRRARRERRAARGRRVRLEGPRRAVEAGAVDRAGPAGGGVRPAHLRAARRLPGRQLLAALPDGAGARSRAVRRGVRAAAGAGHAEHRWLLRARRRLHAWPRSAGSASHPIDRPEEQAIAYLDDHARPGDSAVVVFGAANVVRDARPRGAVPLPLEPARPGPRRRPGHPGRAARERPAPDLGDRRPPVGRRLGARLHQGAGGARRRLRRGRHGRQVHHLPPPTQTREQDRAASSRSRRTPSHCSSGAGCVGIPNDPIGVALWLWLLAICWRLDWSVAVPGVAGLVAVAAGPRGLRPGARRHRRHRLHAPRGVADPGRRVAGPALGRRRRARRCPCSTATAATRA